MMSTTSHKCSKTSLRYSERVIISQGRSPPLKVSKTVDAILRVD